jgi:anti-sigma factor RsiW
MNPGNAWRRSGNGEAAGGNSACGAFLDRHSAYLDGELSPEDAAIHEAHEAGCHSCGRYASVLRRGSAILGDLPEVYPSLDFNQRLQHRLYHVRDEALLAPERALRSWLAAAAGVALIAGGTIVLQATDLGPGRTAEAERDQQQDVALVESWTTPPVPVTTPSPAFPLFTGYTPVVVRRPLYQPVSYELLNGE